MNRRIEAAIRIVLAVTALTLGWIWGSRSAADVARDRGYADGFHAGHEAGQDLGFRKGRSQGFQEGRDAAPASAGGTGWER